jgi:hypothetical protein
LQPAAFFKAEASPSAADALRRLSAPRGDVPVFVEILEAVVAV